MTIRTTFIKSNATERHENKLKKGARKRMGHEIGAKIREKNISTASRNSTTQGLSKYLYVFLERATARRRLITQDFREGDTNCITKQCKAAEKCKPRTVGGIGRRAKILSTAKVLAHRIQRGKCRFIICNTVSYITVITFFKFIFVISV
jgi:hypothetical protein